MQNNQLTSWVQASSVNTPIEKWFLGTKISPLWQFRITRFQSQSYSCLYKWRKTLYPTGLISCFDFLLCLCLFIFCIYKLVTLIFSGFVCLTKPRFYFRTVYWYLVNNLKNPDAIFLTPLWRRGGILFGYTVYSCVCLCFCPYNQISVSVFSATSHSRYLSLWICLV